MLLKKGGVRKASKRCVLFDTRIQCVHMCEVALNRKQCIAAMLSASLKVLLHLCRLVLVSCRAHVKIKRLLASLDDHVDNARDNDSPANHRRHRFAVKGERLVRVAFNPVPFLGEYIVEGAGGRDGRRQTTAAQIQGKRGTRDGHRCDEARSEHDVGWGAQRTDRDIKAKRNISRTSTARFL